MGRVHTLPWTRGFICVKRMETVKICLSTMHGKQSIVWAGSEETISASTQIFLQYQDKYQTLASVTAISADTCQAA